MDTDWLREELRMHAVIANAMRTCKRKGVACGLVSLGLDGRDCIDWFFNGPINEDSNLCSNEVGNCGCVHAEFRAVATAMRCRMKCSLVVNYSPCTSCANLIAVSGCIDRIYYATVTEHDKRGLVHLEKAGIEVVQL